MQKIRDSTKINVLGTLFGEESPGVIVGGGNPQSKTSKKKKGDRRSRGEGKEKT